jgi:ABC-2 type transport system permease protein
MAHQNRGVIYDVGYRPYEGRYLGRAYALGGLILDDLKRALGVKRSWRYKAIIVLLLVVELGIFFFYLLTSELAEVFTGPEIPATLLHPYSAFYEASAFVLFLLSALVAPQLLCDDRRYRVYPLYLARPIQRYDYLLAKGAAVFGVLLAVLLGPALLLFSGRAFLAEDALSYLAKHQRDLWALLASGPIIALFYASFAMGISSLTLSRGYAAGAIIGILILAGMVSTFLLFSVREPWVMLFDLGDLALRVKDALFGTLSPIPLPDGALEPLDPWVYGVGLAGVIALSWGVIWLSYLREAL